LTWNTRETTGNKEHIPAPQPEERSQLCTPRLSSKPCPFGCRIRPRLARVSRQIIANGRDGPLSISDISKPRLESAKEDWLDFRLLIAESQRSPSESLAQIRRNWQQERPLARAEWHFLDHCIRIACDELSGDPHFPSTESLVAVLEALIAMRSLRRHRGADLDRY
jgi:hypothetical protein